MPGTYRLETLILLDCLAEGVRDAAELLLHPTVGRFTSGSSWREESMERKLRLLAARGVITLPNPVDPRIIRITEDGRRIARGGVDLEARWARPWDGQWRMVLFDIAEADHKLRDQFRHELSLARLGYLQGSVWVSPDPLADFRDKVKSMAANPESLLFFEGHPCAGESDSAIVAGAWNFARINERYAYAMAMHESSPRKSDPPYRWRHWLELERQSWLAAVAIDPLLPQPLLPAVYRGPEALRSRRKALRATAEHIFAKG
jgi:phenylacetic acid degradation operon negative regulatory protein